MAFLGRYCEARGAGWAALLCLGVGCAAPRPNLIVISLDTLRADRLGAAGGAGSLSPNLDRFAEESVVFTQAFAQSNETRFSHASLFTSRYPSELGDLAGEFNIPASTPTLASLATAAGYETAAFVAGGHMAGEFGLSGGFSTYEDAADWGGLQHTAPEALAWRAARPAGSPSLVFIHSYDCHARYLKPTPWGYLRSKPEDEGLGAVVGRSVAGSGAVIDGAALSDPEAAMVRAGGVLRFNHGAGSAALDPDPAPLSPADVALVAGLYDGAVSWADLHFGLLMADLEASGALEDSYVVVLSDHGEELGEAGHFGHRLGLDDVNLHVPLLIRPPGGADGRRLDGLVSLLDVTPTLLDLIGAAPVAQARGRSLKPLIEPETGGEVAPVPAVFSEGALRLLSARGPSARLVSEGLSADQPYAAPLLAATPIDGVGLRLTGEAAAGPALQAAMVEWRAALLLGEGTL
jgi:hypothetical protein